MRPWSRAISRRRIFWAALAGITVLALMPWSQELPGPFRWSDKLNHFAAFMLLGLLLMEAYRLSCLVGTALLTFYGGLIEAIQSFLPWRSAEWGDLAVDLLAAAAGVAAWRLFVRLGLLSGKREVGG